MPIPTLYCVSAPSGSGKTSIMRKVLGEESEIVSFTTREPREGEVEGKDYLFVTKKDFSVLNGTTELIECTQYSNNYYGITSDELTKKLRNNNKAFVIVDYNGMQQIKNVYPNTVSIFIKTSKEDAILNMFARGDNFKNIQDRLYTFDKELQNRIHYDFIVSNYYGKFEETVKIVKSIVENTGK